MVLLDEDEIPRLKISDQYRKALESEDEQEFKELKTKKYIQEKVRAALWLIRAINLRKRTIFRVAESIVKYQKDFFDKGPAFLKPLVLKTVAADIEVHESTVSRITNNKYMATSHGVFELKYFFGSGVAKETGSGSVSSEAIKTRIQELIQGEDSSKPLSDQKITNTLKREMGITMARRTVSKYREALKILPASKRRKVS